MLSIELAVATPAFLDLTFVGLEMLPAPGEERFAGELLRSPGGGAITAVAAARLGLQTALVAPLGSDLGGEYVRRALEGIDVTDVSFELFDATHMAIEYRYPLSLKNLAERLSA